MREMKGCVDIERYGELGTLSLIRLQNRPLADFESTFPQGKVLGNALIRPRLRSTTLPRGEGVTIIHHACGVPFPRGKF